MYNCGKPIIIIETDFLRIFKWFHENFRGFNPDKCNFMVLDDSNCTCNFTCNGATISSEDEKVLDITTDDKLTFKSHIGNIIKTANQMIELCCEYLSVRCI